MSVRRRTGENFPPDIAKMRIIPEFHEVRRIKHISQRRHISENNRIAGMRNNIVIAPGQAVSCGPYLKFFPEDIASVPCGRGDSNANIQLPGQLRHGLQSGIELEISMRPGIPQRCKGIHIMRKDRRYMEVEAQVVSMYLAYDLFKIRQIAFRQRKFPESLGISISERIASVLYRSSVELFVFMELLPITSVVIKLIWCCRLLIFCRASVFSRSLLEKLD